MLSRIAILIAQVTLMSMLTWHWFKRINVRGYCSGALSW